MWHNPAHMTAGHAAAAKSRKTPKHLRPHLKGLSMNSSTKGNSPKTAAKPEMGSSVITGRAGSLQQARSQINASPMPFQNPQGSVKLGAPAGPTDSTGNGKTPNAGGNPTSKPGKHPPTGPTGGYKPKKNYGPVGKPSFYGSR